MTTFKEHLNKLMQQKDEVTQGQIKYLKSLDSKIDNETFIKMIKPLQSKMSSECLEAYEKQFSTDDKGKKVDIKSSFSIFKRLGI